MKNTKKADSNVMWMIATLIIVIIVLLISLNIIPNVVDIINPALEKHGECFIVPGEPGICVTSKDMCLSSERVSTFRGACLDLTNEDTKEATKDLVCCIPEINPTDKIEFNYYFNSIADKQYLFPKIEKENLIEIDEPEVIHFELYAPHRYFNYSVIQFEIKLNDGTPCFNPDGPLIFKLELPKPISDLNKFDMNKIKSGYCTIILEAYEKMDSKMPLFTKEFNIHVTEN